MKLSNRLLTYSAVLLVLATMACNKPVKKKATRDFLTTVISPAKDPLVNQQPIPTDAVAGDFNGDGVKEFVWLVPPTLDSSGTDCTGDCNSYLQFSNPAIPSIKVEQCIGGQPVNQGDLNDNKTDEIGLLPQWFTSCWSGYHVYSLEKGRWTHAVPVFSTYCNQWETGIVPIEKDPNQPGHVIIRYSEMTADSIMVKEKSIAVN